MFILIVGGGRTGSSLGRMLLDEGHTIKIIDERADVIERLRREFPAESILQGDGSSPSTLEAAGVQGANVLAAVTVDDEVNLVIATLARFEFNVRRVIARVNDPRNAWLFTPEMGVDVGLNQADILARLIAEEMSLGDMLMLLKLRRGEYSLVEERLRPGAPAVGTKLKDLHMPGDCAIAAVFRKGKVIVSHSELVFQADDDVLVVTSKQALSPVRSLFDVAGGH